MNAVTPTMFPFDVRPYPRETLESYGRRLFEANFSTEAHFVALTRQRLEGRTKNDLFDAQHEVLRAHTKRDVLHFEASPNNWLTHAPTEGDPVRHLCKHFRDQLPRRRACQQCAHGADVEQYPHFDRVVCIKHQRWIGLWGGASTQHNVTAEVVRAQVTFKKLRRSGRLDFRLYLFLIKSLGDDFAPHETLDIMEPLVFAPAINIAHAITTSRFARHFFDPATPFSQRWTHLKSVVEGIVGTEAPIALHALWAYLRPTVRAVQAVASKESPRFRDHDYQLRPSMLSQLTERTHEIEPFTNYLVVSGDTQASFSHTMKRYTYVNDEVEEMEVRSHTCTAGHTFDYLPPNQLPETVLANTYVPACGMCSPGRVKIGRNDLVTMAPKVAAEFDQLRNGGLTARDIAINSSIKRWWLCPKGHSHRATPSRKTRPGYTCAICDDRVIQPGINSFFDTHPRFASMWAADWRADDSPLMMAASSNLLRDWTCAEGHTFPARPWELASGKRGCIKCTHAQGIPFELSLAATHPHIAMLLHPELNEGLSAADVTHGERREVLWTCPNNDSHVHKSRIDKMSLGQQCPVCASRKLRPGDNDLATVEPVLTLEYHSYLNLKDANEIFPSDHVLVWVCLEEDKHIQKQTVQNRRASGGCTECLPEKRILHKMAAELEAIAT